MYHEQVAEFAKQWQPFRGLLEPGEQAYRDVPVDAALERPHSGHVQNEADAKWPIIFSMLVEQQQEIATLRGELAELRQQREPSPSDSEAPA